MVFQSGHRAGLWRLRHRGKPVWSIADGRKNSSSHDWLDWIPRGNNINDSLARGPGAGRRKVGFPNRSSPNGWYAMGRRAWKTPEELTPTARSSKAGLSKGLFGRFYLIFDQFEELFILGTVPAAKRFLLNIQGVVRSELTVKLIFDSREEVLRATFSSSNAPPKLGLAKKSYRVEPITWKVKMGIKGRRLMSIPNISSFKSGEKMPWAESNIFTKIKEGRSHSRSVAFLQVFFSTQALSDYHWRQKTLRTAEFYAGQKWMKWRDWAYFKAIF